MIFNRKMNRSFILLFLISILPRFVSAEDVTSQAQNLGQTFFTGIFGFFGTLVNPLIGNTEMTSRVFLAILLGMVVYSVISIMFSSSKPWIQWVISISVTSLALLGMPAGYVAALLTNYGAMGMTLLTVIPFLIVLTFSLRAENLLYARIIWILYGFYYFGMYISDIFKNSDTTHGLLTATNTPYFVGMVVGILMFIFIGWARKELFKGWLDGVKEKGRRKIDRIRAVNNWYGHATSMVNAPAP